jgi:hypothetical protein
MWLKTRAASNTRWPECYSKMAQPVTNRANCRLIPFPYHDGVLLEPIDYLVLLIGTLISTGWGFVLLGLS